jgi:hypothetical protein
MKAKRQDTEPRAFRTLLSLKTPPGRAPGGSGGPFRAGTDWLEAEAQLSLEGSTLIALRGNRAEVVIVDA